MPAAMRSQRGIAASMRAGRCVLCLSMLHKTSPVAFACAIVLHLGQATRKATFDAMCARHREFVFDAHDMNHRSGAGVDAEISRAKSAAFEECAKALTAAIDAAKTSAGAPP